MLATSPEQIITDQDRAAYKLACRDGQRMSARNSAAQPRKLSAYRPKMEGHPLLFKIMQHHDRTDICWPIIRELCAFRRTCLTGFGKNVPRAIYENAAILIFAELIRMKAAE